MKFGFQKYLLWFDIIDAMDMKRLLLDPLWEYGQQIRRTTARKREQRGTIAL